LWQSLRAPCRRGYDILATVDGKMPPAVADRKSYVAEILWFSGRCRLSELPVQSKNPGAKAGVSTEIVIPEAERSKAVRDLETQCQNSTP
jgi:hypothetical protein